jgi:hypothetical protein
VGSQVARDGEGAGHDRREDRPDLFDGEVRGDDPGCAGSHHGTNDSFVDHVDDDNSRDPARRPSGEGLGQADDSDVGLWVVVGDEMGRDPAERLGQLLVGGHVVGERDRPHR